MPTPDNIWGENPSAHNAQNEQRSIKEILLAIYKDFFGLQNISGDQDFFEMGGDSLKALILTIQIAKKFELKLPPPFLFYFPTINQASNEIEKIFNNTQRGAESHEH